MPNENFTRTISVSASVDKAYWALTQGMHKWWTTPDRPMVRTGDRSKFTFPPGRSFWTFEAVALEPGKLVEMRCVEALHLHEGQPADIEQEWLDTRVRWDIKSCEEGAEITLEHIGLVPDLLCHGICSAGWDMFFTNSLKQFLDTGTGHPHPSTQKEAQAG
ncbi:Activator of Hsp90 ATPase homolog 1-like protein [Parasphingorhabdus marina DSM 22363]|uniref:Activator of Hsp90 ATPase homolog 1-like protein n=1 Tax=Parasphingorhabdus marina DSM 22363 TaxID=1123272 RepID=A0A1N6D6A7_9SPHN|nr:SRPBCC domain-containing protein [Parasphingorhabdus marina]SIN66237.1 Activator of Hsp90 ATPase homolog 1-like protein [Parasphingorhabdus marina DSM 22363]